MYFCNMQSLQAYLTERLKNNHFINHIGIELITLELGEATIQIKMQVFHEQQNGFLHGGVTATLCDVATGIAAYTVAPEGKNVVTADLQIQYLNPITGPVVETIGTVIKKGKLMTFCEGKVFNVDNDGHKTLCATATSIMVNVDIPVK